MYRGLGRGGGGGEGVESEGQMYLSEISTVGANVHLQNKHWGKAANVHTRNKLAGVQMSRLHIQLGVGGWRGGGKCPLVYFLIVGEQISCGGANAGRPIFTHTKMSVSIFSHCGGANILWGCKRRETYIHAYENLLVCKRIGTSSLKYAQYSLTA